MTSKTASLWAEFQVSDPGLLRWHGALRTTACVALAIGLMGFLTFKGLVPLLAPAIGVVFCMMSGAFPREFTVRARLTTIASATVIGALSVTVAAALDEWPLLGDASFVVVLVAAVACQSLGPRAIACGFVAVVNIYLVLFLKADIHQIAPTLLALPIAVAIVVVFHFFVLPDRPRKVLDRIVTVVERRGSMFLRTLGSMREDRGEERLRLRRLLGSLNETILAAEDQMVVVDPVKARHLSLLLLRFEVALSDVAAAALLAHPLPRVDRVRLRLTAMRLNMSRWSPLKGQHDAQRTPLIDAILEVDGVASEMGAFRAAPATIELPEAVSAAMPARRPPFAWRPATRAGLAALLSIAGGSALSSNRWFWATLTVYLMFLGARSHGDAVHRGLQRVFGTLVGLLAGILVSLAVSGHLYVEVAASLVCVFAISYVFAVSQVLAVFCVTVLLGIVYSLLGYQTSDVLLLRLEETAIGAIAAGIVSFFVFPHRTMDHVGTTASRLLSALADTVRLSAQRLSGDYTAAPVARLRQADRLLRDLRGALRPLQAQKSVVWWARSGTDMPAVLLLIVWTRVLATAIEASETAGTDAALIGRLQTLATAIDAIAQANYAPSAEQQSEPLTSTPIPLALPVATRLQPVITNIESAVALLRDRLKRDGWSALALRRPL